MPSTRGLGTGRPSPLATSPRSTLRTRARTSPLRTLLASSRLGVVGYSTAFPQTQTPPLRFASQTLDSPAYRRKDAYRVVAPGLVPRARSPADISPKLRFANASQARHGETLPVSRHRHAPHPFDNPSRGVLEPRLATASHARDARSGSDRPSPLARAPASPCSHAALGDAPRLVTTRLRRSHHGPNPSMQTTPL